MVQTRIQSSFCSIDLKQFAIPNPKQNGASRQGRAGWYPYYAGYCPLFVEQLLTAISHSRATILDPWNGAGTTTQVAHDMGHRALGFDLNPSVHVVAKARLISLLSAGEVLERLPRVVGRAQAYRAKSYFADDPLSNWFSDEGLTSIRHLDRALQEEFSPGRAFGLGVEPLVPSSRSSCFCYTALFQTLRRLTAAFRGSNPTWLKIASSNDERVDVNVGEFYDVFSTELQCMFDSLASERAVPSVQHANARCRLGVAASHRLPVRTHDVDVVLASPPYLTRIDYAVSTAVELATMGIGRGKEMRRLRNAMTGTSTVRSKMPIPKSAWGRACLKLLATVSRHDSKASKSYYVKTLLQYFDDMFESLVEINRCLRRGGHCILVVQDSYYKDIEIPLATIIRQMAASLNWQLFQRSDFPVGRSMLGVNTRSHAYRTNSTVAESVLWFTT